MISCTFLSSCEKRVEYYKRNFLTSLILDFSAGMRLVMGCLASNFFSIWMRSSTPSTTRCTCSTSDEPNLNKQIQIHTQLPRQKFRFYILTHPLQESISPLSKTGQSSVELRINQLTRITRLKGALRSKRSDFSKTWFLLAVQKKIAFKSFDKLREN